MPEIDIVAIVIWFIVFLFSLSVHESAHAWTSDQFGDDTGRMLGRVTLNPGPHIDVFGTVIFPLIGIFAAASGAGIAMFGWAKPVPVNPLNWREKDKANFWTSAAGPLSNFALATIFFVTLKVLVVAGVVDVRLIIAIVQSMLTLPASDGILVPIVALLWTGVWLNIILGLFNLLPIPPLDGSGVLESVLPYNAREGYEQIKPYGMFLLIALLFTGVFGLVLGPVYIFTVRLLIGF